MGCALVAAIAFIAHPGDTHCPNIMQRHAVTSGNRTGTICNDADCSPSCNPKFHDGIALNPLSLHKNAPATSEECDDQRCRPTFA